MLDLQREENLSPKTWRSCCLIINPIAAKYFIQVSVLVGLIVISTTMLVYDNSCNSQRWWSGLLMVAVCVFLPSPKLT